MCFTDAIASLAAKVLTKGTDAIYDKTVDIVKNDKVNKSLFKLVGSKDVIAFVSRRREGSWVNDQVMSSFEIQGFLELQQAYAKSGANLQLMLEPPVGNQVGKYNLICIGGPDGNEMTGRLLDQMGMREALPHVGGDDDTPLSWFGPTSQYGTEFEPTEKRIISDHALIISAPSLYAPKSGLRITFVMGRYGFGTYGAIRALLSPEGWDLKGLESSLNQRFMALIRSDASPASDAIGGPLYASHEIIQQALLR